mmetsp:Transcript_54/g.255  ORF Transcript_54/g.255 Transcript_54/m.255 type:complete len:227 (+) Transcript_54:71-751(+)
MLRQNLFTAVMSSLAKSKVRQNLDGVFLLLDDGCHEILDGDHSNNSLVVVNNGKMPNTFGHHFGHARIHCFVNDSRDNVGSLGGNFLDRGFLGCSAQKRNLANVITFTDDSRHVPSFIGNNQTTNVVGSKLLDSIVHRRTLLDGEVNVRVSREFQCIRNRRSVANRRKRTSHVGDNHGTGSQRARGHASSTSGESSEHCCRRVSFERNVERATLWIEQFSFFNVER